MQTVQDIMRTAVLSVPPNALIEHALDLMLENHVSGLPVVDQDQRLVGVISEYDALVLLTESGEEYWPIHPVESFMTTQVQSVDQDMPVDQLATQFRNKSVRRLPVLQDGKLVGIVSRRELIRAIRDQRLCAAQMPLAGSMASWN
jgi:CBS domain-containing protein